jgi:arylsulfatase A-like enzyme
MRLVSLFGAFESGLLVGTLVATTEVTFLVCRHGRSFFQALPYALVVHAVLGGLFGLLFGLLAWGMARLPWWRLTPAALAWAGVGALSGPYVAREHLYNLLRRLDLALLERPELLDGGLFLLGVGAFPLLALLWRHWLGRRGWFGRVGRGMALTLLLLALSFPLQALVRVPEDISASAPTALAALADRPNVILIIADALRADALSCYGGLVPTPNLDSLAANGQRYTRSIAQASWTKPSFGTIFTSLHPSSHTAVDKIRSLPQAATTLAEVLAEAGYLTAGLANNPYLAPYVHFDQGFAQYTYLEPGYYAGADRYAARLSIYQLLKWLHLHLLRDYREVRYYYRDAAEVSTWATDWLDHHRQSRFFLFLHYMDPHDPYFEHPYNGRAYPPCNDCMLEPTSVADIRRVYDGEVQYMDAEIGHLLDWLHREGLYEGALIIFTADHGEEFLEHGGWNHGVTLYEEVIHVPLIIKYPEGRRAGEVVTTLARGLDLAPTILDVTELPIPLDMQGQSLCSAEAPPYALSETEMVGAGDLVLALQGQRYKWIWAAPDNARGLPCELLFDLVVDAAERVNLASQERDLARQWEALLWETLARVEAESLDPEAGYIDEQAEELLRRLGY